MKLTNAAELAADLREGRTDPVDVVSAVFDSLAGSGDKALFIRQTRARAEVEARAARERLRAGNPASLLDGVPIAWKDLFDLQGTVTTAGSVVLMDTAPAAEDADLVHNAMRGGMLSVGAVNMTEFAYSGIGLNPHYGTPRNPHDPKVARSPGGSSSGSGAVVAAGVVPLSIGTDTGGSIRIPASFNGVVGYKPSTGRHSMRGVFPLSWTLDSLGPLAHSVQDCVLADAVLRGVRRPEAVASDLSGLDLVIADRHFLDDVDPAVSAAFEASLSRLSSAGARIRKVALPELTEAQALMAEVGPLASVEAMVIHKDRLGTEAEARMDTRVIRRIRMGEGISAADYARLLAGRARLVASFSARLGGGLLLAPTTASTAMPIAPLEADLDVFFHHNFRTLRSTAIGNFLDICALAIPNGADGDGMPTSLMIMASHGYDTALLSAGLSLENLVRG